VIRVIRVNPRRFVIRAVRVNPRRFVIRAIRRLFRDIRGSSQTIY
jgi:hypothetical protein